ncbi:MAG TPA: hypothetical protein VMV46_18445 [Thermoanaerobaculia bacterium]|nr:hypothetical protein [Thermoanaerobaculia bacterium]
MELHGAGGRRSPIAGWVAGLACLAMLGCGGGASDGADAPPGPTIAEAAAGPSCLAEHVEDLCGLLTEELVRARIPEAPAELERESRPPSMGFNVCSYAWRGGRRTTMKVLDREIEAEVEDLVALQWVRPVRGDDKLARFRNQYRAPTHEERARLREAMEEALDEAAVEGEVSAAGAEAGKGLASAVSASAVEFEEVSGVGDAAAWGGAGPSRKGLKVLDGDHEMEVVVEVSDDPEIDRSLAIDLARDILARCRG